MILLLVGAAAGQPSATDPGAWLSFLGPFIPFGGLALWVIISQQKQIAARDQRIRELSDQMVEQAQATLPTLSSATRALEETVRELERRAR